MKKINEKKFNTILLLISFLFLIIVLTLELFIGNENSHIEGETLNEKEIVYHINFFDRDFTFAFYQKGNKLNINLNNLLELMKLNNIDASQILNIYPRIIKNFKMKKLLKDNIYTFFEWEISYNYIKRYQFKKPIKNLVLSELASDYPGAIRYYRHGIHKGIDMSFVKGIGDADFGTPLYACYGGVIVRIKNDHKMFYKEDIFQKLRLKSIKSYYTPEDVLDFFRGNQIYIKNDHLLFVYSHFLKVYPYLKIGMQIKKGDYLGEMGNSGVEYMGVIPHLHLEIYFNYQIIGTNRYRRDFKEELKIYKFLFRD